MTEKNGRKLPIAKRGNRWRIDYRGLPQDFWPEQCKKSGQLTYESKKAAELAAANVWDDYQTRRGIAFDFTPEHRDVAIRAFSELKELPLDTLVDAAKSYREHFDPERAQRTVNQIVDEFLASREGANLSNITINDYKWRLGRLASAFGDRRIHDLTTLELEQWMDSENFTGVNRKNYRNYLNILYRFAVARGYTNSNPAQGIPRVRVKQKIPVILSSTEVRTLLLEAGKHSEGRMLAYFAIGCFCGLRPYELRRTLWGNVDSSSKEIYVTREACKTSEDRYVSMPDCLIEWLKILPHQAKHTTICFERKDFDTVRKKAGMLTKWAPDIMRHSAASHLYKLKENPTYVTAQMGHGLGVFMKHYKRAVPETEAQAYFNVLPTDEPPEAEPAPNE